MGDLRRPAAPQGVLSPLHHTAFSGLTNCAVEVTGRLWEFFTRFLKSYHWSESVHKHSWQQCGELDVPWGTGSCPAHTTVCREMAKNPPSARYWPAQLTDTGIFGLKGVNDRQTCYFCVFMSHHFFSTSLLPICLPEGESGAMVQEHRE